MPSFFRHPTLYSAAGRRSRAAVPHCELRMSAFHNAPQFSSPTLWLLFWLCTCSFPAGGDEPAEMKRESQYSALRIVLGNGALTTSGLGGQMDLTFRLQGTVPGARYHIILQVLNAVTRKIDQQQRVTVSIHEDFAGEVSMSLLPPGEKRDKVRISIEAWSADVQAPSAKQRLMARHEAILPLVDEVHMQRYVNLTLTALARTEGWHDVKPSAVQVEDVTRSGNGGMRTYKLTAPTSAVALRVGNRRDENTTRRLIAVTEMMAAHGLTPRILATGRTWMIMEWKGGTRELSLQDEQDPEASFAAIGKLLARIHAIDTAWFDDHQHHLRRGLVAQHSLPQGDEASISRTALQRRLPEAETESPSNPLHVDPVCLPPPAFTPRSHPPDTALASPPVLLASAVEETLSRLTNASLPELSAWQRRARMRYKRRALSDVAISLGHACAACGAWATEDEAAGRRVTTHGDFHPHQIIYVPNPSGGASSLLVLDFDFTNVSTALSDLSFMIAHCGDDRPNLKQAFLRGYLRELGGTTGDDDEQQQHHHQHQHHQRILRLLADCELDRLAAWARVREQESEGLVALERYRHAPRERTDGDGGDSGGGNGAAAARGRAEACPDGTASSASLHAPLLASQAREVDAPVGARRGLCELVLDEVRASRLMQQLLGAA